MNTIVTAGLVGLLLTGCGTGADHSAARSTAFPELPQKIVKPVPLPAGGPHPSPPAGAAFHERVAFGLREKTLAMANTAGTTTARCPAGLTLRKGAEAVCVSTYEGLRIEWDVLVGASKDRFGNDVQWSAEPRTGIITRDGAANALYTYYAPDLVRCGDIPKAVLVPAFVRTHYSCQTVKDGRAGKPLRAEARLNGPGFLCRQREPHSCVG
ncbi:hypothetical protein [Streptomyces sp. B1I3]|uniref:hypothetical protein n=1 Tax=Streptomyces sp. B1I3 TaxID=3042264 RepID=UPI0027D77D9D|nr:hypothetical protein [Streptomyces sp. B1I3]